MGRRLGQHFLKDRNVLKKITKALEIQSGDFVIEIGPGQGSLTELLMEAPINKVIAIEKDKKLALDLKLKNRDNNMRKREIKKKMEEKDKEVRGGVVELTPASSSAFLP